MEHEPQYQRISGVQHHYNIRNFPWCVGCIEGNRYFRTRKEAREFARAHPLKLANFIEDITPQQTPFSK